MDKRSLSRTAKYVALGGVGGTLALAGFCLGGLSLIALVFTGPPPVAVLLLVFLILVCGASMWQGFRWAMRARRELRSASRQEGLPASMTGNMERQVHEQQHGDTPHVPQFPLMLASAASTGASVPAELSTAQVAGPFLPDRAVPPTPPPQPPAAVAISHLPEASTAATMCSTSPPPPEATQFQPALPSAPVYIPAPPTPPVDQRFVEIVPSEEGVGANSRITLSISHETRNTAFLAEMRRYHRREARPTDHVPFMQYWPTYSAMSREQQQWFFYWRSLVRKEQYLPTDLSYIFVHVYEILNLVEEPDPQHAADRLWKLWLHYRVQYPKLDRYLADWGGDLLAVHCGSSAADAWWHRCLAHAIRLPASIVNVMIQHYVDTHTTQDMPYGMWTTLMSYQPRNKFYAEHNRDGRLDRSYDRAILLVEHHVLQVSGNSLLEQHTTQQLSPVHKPVFVSALMDDGFPRTVTLGIARNYIECRPLTDHLNSVVKHTENLLRKQVGVARKLSGITLDPVIASVLDAAFSTMATVPSRKTKRRQEEAAPAALPHAPARLNLDLKRVAALHHESAEIGALLTPETDPEPAGPPKPLYTDLAVMRRLWTQIEPHEQRIITDIYHAQQSIREGVKDVLPQLAILGAMERINAFATELLGDELIYQRPDSIFTLAEDFLDELSIVIGEMPPLADASVVEAQPEANPAPTVIDLVGAGQVDSELQIPLLLTSGERTLLQRFLTEHTLSESYIDEIARTHHSMGNMVLESLNEKAAEILGFPPIYLDGTDWTLDVEYVDTLRQQLPQEGIQA